MPSNVLPLHLKQTVPPIIWIFTEGESDRIESRLPFKIISTLATIKFALKCNIEIIKKCRHQKWNRTEFLVGTQAQKA